MTEHIEWRDRIVGYGKQPADQFLANPNNWRIHPREQREAIKAALTEVGWVAPVIVNRRSGYVIDGHERIWNALKNGNAEVPFVEVDLSEEEEAYVLATFDPIGAMARADAASLDAVLRQVQTESDAIRQLLTMEAEMAGLYLADEPGNKPESIEDISASLPGAMALKADMTFESNLPWDMPPLREDMLAEIPRPLDIWVGPDVCQDDGITHWLYCWGSDSTRGLPFERTLLAFYVDDVRFESFWNSPEIQVAKVLNAGISTAIAPNFSLWFGSPRAIHLFNIYRSRWVARYMQEAGIKIIPDVNFADERSFEFCLLGIPAGAPAIAAQIQTIRGDEEMERAVSGFKMALDAIRPQSALIYGGPAAREVMARVVPTCPVTFVNNRVSARRDLMERQKYALRV